MRLALHRRIDQFLLHRVRQFHREWRRCLQACRLPADGEVRMVRASLTDKLSITPAPAKNTARTTVIGQMYKTTNGRGIRDVTQR